MARVTSRKFIIGTMGALGAGIASAWAGRQPLLRWAMTRKAHPDLQLTAAPGDGQQPCVLTSSQPEGPFYFPSPERRNIVEDRPGLPFTLRIQVVRARGCSPLEGAVVEVWHTDAGGVYSGYPEEIAHDLWKSLVFVGPRAVRKGGEFHVGPVEKTRFLRGLQRTGSDGWVEFRTIFPGWYEGRTPHIHFKVAAGPHEQLTSQFYFEQATCDRVYTTVAPYTQYGPCPYTTDTDTVIQSAAHGLLLKPSWSGGSMEATARIGIQQA